MFETQGAEQYFGEPVSQLEHALQTAHRAALNHATDALVVAALLHDIGHLLSGEAESSRELGVDAWHEHAGFTFLSRHFGPDVAEPVRLHVAAKRYLCAVDDRYVRQLSPASTQSLALQGGPMSDEEAAAFAAEPYLLDAIVLRRWDDAAKIPGLDVPPLASYLPHIERALVQRVGS